MVVPDFEFLNPDLILSLLEESYGLSLDGSLQPYASYVNRVYGVRADSGEQYIAKFYRPGRWTVEALAEEHEFVFDCVEAELPVVAPIPDGEGYSLQTIEVERPDGLIDASFALYPKRGGRGFDAEGDEDWYRLGSLVGRLHAVAARRPAAHRLTCTPAGSTRGFVEELLVSGVVYADLLGEFETVVREGLDLIEPLFDGVSMQRIHGDFHRANVLERGDDGLMIIDFDDMMVGPTVQDLWLLLPDHAFAATRELTHILDGYQQFAPFRRQDLRLIEPLRFMRMIYYLAWSAYQLSDHRFRESNPDWGSKAFWIREIEDLRTQLAVIVEDMRE